MLHHALLTTRLQFSLPPQVELGQSQNPSLGGGRGGGGEGGCGGGGGSGVLFQWAEVWGSTVTFSLSFFPPLRPV